MGPTTPLFLNLLTRQFVGPTGTILNGLDAKLGEKRKLEIAFVSDGDIQDLATDTTVGLAIRDLTVATVLATASASRIGWGFGSRWIATVNFGATELVASVGASQLKNYQLELTATFPPSSEQIIKSQPLIITINNKVS